MRFVIMLGETTQARGDMATTTAMSSKGKPIRRSSRINETVRLTVSGVDSYRGPYREQVSTTTVSAHGCKYDSKRDVFTNSRVTLEIGDGKQGSKPIAARGLVKYVVRPLDPSGYFQTAIELEDPGNIWGIASPPTDWLPFCEEILSGQPATASPKPVAAAKPELPAPPVHDEKRAGNGASHSGHSTQAAPSSSIATKTKSSVSSSASVEGDISKTNGHKSETLPETNSNGGRPVGQLMGELQREMEKTLVEAASAAVRERAAATLEEVRAELKDELRGEARRILAESASEQAGAWVEQSLKSLKQGMQEGARTLHQQWVKKIESDLQIAMAEMQERRRELDQNAASASASAAECFQKSIEVSRTEAVDRVVSRLKDQSAPVLEEAKATLSEVRREKEELAGAITSVAEKSMERLEETCTAAAKQFEMIIQERLDAANEQMDRAIKLATNVALQSLRASSEQQENEAKTRMQEALEGVTMPALSEWKEQAAEESRQFAENISKLSRDHLDSVSSAISDLAKGFANITRR